MDNALIDQLLYNRGIHTDEERNRFLEPSYEEHIHDPFLLPNMDKAVERILSAIKNNEKIVIYSDYDADGIPGAVVLHDFFKKINYSNFSNYIPHRHDEGFGLNLEAIEQFVGDKVKLMFTIDCGITDVEEVARAQAGGIDVIVTDHHIPHGDLPVAYAIVNPKLAESQYPFPDLCGAAVIFKVVQALITKGNFNITEGWEKWLLDMVGLATLSDMVPLKGENRVLAYYGLKVLKKSPRPGLAKLFSKMNMKRHQICEDDITFMIAPRINAASRMGHPIDAFNMLAEQKQDQAAFHAEHLISLNDERKRLTASINTSIRAMLHKKEPRPVLVIGDVSWKPGVLGLVANNLAEEYKRPIFVWGRDNGTLIKGSVRTGNSANIVDLMEKVKDIFVDFGGHAMSGGFSISHEKIDYLDDALNGAYQLITVPEPESNTQLFESELPIEALTERTLSQIEKLSPFGVGNIKPIFLIKNVKPISIKAFGKGKTHTEVIVQGPKGPIQAVAFFKTPDQFTALSIDNTIQVVGSLERSYWRGSSPLRLRIVDIR